MEGNSRDGHVAAALLTREHFSGCIGAGVLSNSLVLNDCISSEDAQKHRTRKLRFSSAGEPQVSLSPRSALSVQSYGIIKASAFRSRTRQLLIKAGFLTFDAFPPDVGERNSPCPKRHQTYSKAESSTNRGSGG